MSDIANVCLLSFWGPVLLLEG